MKSKISIVLFVISLALAGLLVIQTREAKKESILAQKLQVQVEGMDADQKKAQARVHELEQEVLRIRGESQALATDLYATRAAMTNQLAAAATGAAASPEAAKAAGAEGKNPASMLGEMLKTPQMRKLMEQQQKAMVDMMYEPLMKELQLTPEQQDQFKKMLLDRQMQSVEHAGDMFDQNSTNHATAMKEMGDAMKSREDEIKSFLGDQNYQKYQDYNQTIGERMVLNQFSQQTNLTPEQKDRMMTIMAEEKKAAVAVQPGLTDPVKGMEALQSPEATERLLSQQQAVNTQIYERAKDVLTADQLQSFGSFQSNQINMQRLGLEMARKMMQPSDGKAAAPASP